MQDLEGAANVGSIYGALRPAGTVGPMVLTRWGHGWGWILMEGPRFRPGLDSSWVETG